MSVNIHGKEYITVAERVQEYHTDNEKGLSITTEVLAHAPNVVVKATVVTKKGTFTGISSANPSKPIEKMAPYEVAETSAVGRALGFAGYGIVEGIATADEVTKAEASAFDESDQYYSEPESLASGLGSCKSCNAPNITYKTGRIGCSKYCWRK